VPFLSAAAFSFETEWRLPNDADAVFDALAAADRYPMWWPQVLSATPLDDDSGELVIRSKLPYRLRVVATREIEDPVAHTLRATLTGDLTGFSSWQISTNGAGCSAVFIEQVSAGGALGLAARVGRRALEWNHAVMMRSGEQGLRRHLADLGARRPGTST
jgi:hypothetical protein